MHFLLFYEVGEEYVARRAEFRKAHLGMAWEASDRGELVLGGALVALVDRDRLIEAEQMSRALLLHHPREGMLWKVLSVALVRQGKDALPALRRAAGIATLSCQGMGAQAWASDPSLKMAL